MLYLQTRQPPKATSGICSGSPAANSGPQPEPGHFLIGFLWHEAEQQVSNSWQITPGDRKVRVSEVRAEYTLTPVSVTAEPSAQAHTFHRRSAKDTERRRQARAGALQHTNAGSSNLFYFSHIPAVTSDSKLKCSFLQQWNLWLLAIAWGVPNIFS